MLLTNFWRSKSGNFALMLALGVPAMLSAVALAVDVSTLMKAKGSLQNALDAANLASSHLGDAEASRNDVFNRYFQANVATHGELSNARATLTVDKGINYITTKATASADVNLNFAFLFGNERHIAVDAAAMESNNQLEVVLVLDNTGSMAGARISALRQADEIPAGQSGGDPVADAQGSCLACSVRHRGQRRWRRIRSVLDRQGRQVVDQRRQFSGGQGQAP